MSRFRTAGAVLLVLLGAGLLIQVTNRTGVPPKEPANVSLEIPAVEGQPVIETVDLSNGNVHVQIPIRGARRKPAAPRSDH